MKTCETPTFHASVDIRKLWVQVWALHSSCVNTTLKLYSIHALDSASALGTNASADTTVTVRLYVRTETREGERREGGGGGELRRQIGTKGVNTTDNFYFNGR